MFPLYQSTFRLTWCHPTWCWVDLVNSHCLAWIDHDPVSIYNSTVTALWFPKKMFLSGARITKTAMTLDFGLTGTFLVHKAVSTVTATNIISWNSHQNAKAGFPRVTTKEEISYQTKSSGLIPDTGDAFTLLIHHCSTITWGNLVMQHN